MARLSVGHVTQGFGSLTVLDDVSLTVESGRVACLLGPSGCGKTAPFHVVAGLERPSAGRVLLGERDVTGCPGQLSYMLQKDLLLPSRPSWTTSRCRSYSWARRATPPARRRASSCRPSDSSAPRTAGPRSSRAACGSAPQAGEPTRIVGAERIDRPRSERQVFNLTEDFLAHNRRVLALSGERALHRSPRKRVRSAKNTRYSPASHFSELSQKRFTRPL